MSMRRPRIGVIGAGKWGMNIVRTCARLGVLAAACDTDLHPLEEIRCNHSGVRIFCDYPTMFRLAKLDAAVVAVPAQRHAQVALDAIGAGLDVLVEKPLALSVADAERIVDAARAAGQRIVVGHLLLYHPAVRLMMQAIARGAIGDLRHIRARRLRWGRLRAHEDVWWSFAPHDVAVMLALFGEEPAAVTFATGAYVRRHLADVAYADFRFSEGRTAHLEVAWIDPDKSSRLDVFGSRGVLSFIDVPEAPRLLHTPCGDRLDTRGEPELWREEARELEVPPGEPLELELRAFCRAVRGGPMPPSDGEEGLAVVRTLAALGEREAMAFA
jgi:UDP-2-acetamido-3-amino-2,3-dideoxy-glucuronate N-acetyltransferase